VPDQALVVERHAVRDLAHEKSESREGPMGHLRLLPCTLTAIVVAAANARSESAGVENADKAAAITAQAYPSALPADTTRGQVDQLVAFLRQGAPGEVFRGSDESWQQTITILKDSGAISEHKPVAAYYTNAFVPAP
jgi:hypothetical protein